MAHKTDEVVIKYYSNGVEVNYYDHMELKEENTDVVTRSGDKSNISRNHPKLNDKKLKKPISSAFKHISTSTVPSTSKHVSTAPAKPTQLVRPSKQLRTSTPLKSEDLSAPSTSKETLANSIAKKYLDYLQLSASTNISVSQSLTSETSISSHSTSLPPTISKNIPLASRQHRINLNISDALIKSDDESDTENSSDEENLVIDTEETKETAKKVSKKGFRISIREMRESRKRTTSNSSKGTVRSDSPLTVLAKREVEKYFDPSALEYHPNMARKYPGAEDRTPQQEEYRRKNSMAARISRAKAKEIEKQRETIANRISEENNMRKMKLAAISCYANKLAKLISRPSIDFLSIWKMEGKLRDETKANLLKEFARHTARKILKKKEKPSESEEKEKLTQSTEKEKSEPEEPTETDETDNK